MKKIVLAFLVFPLWAWAQTPKLDLLMDGYNPAPTTQDEFNYLTKGYKIALESGLDVKSGYEFIDIERMEDGDFSFDFKFFVRTQSKELAGILILAKSKFWNTTYYICMPNRYTSPFIKDYQKGLDAMSNAMRTSYNKIMDQFAFSFLYVVMKVEHAEN